MSRSDRVDLPGQSRPLQVEFAWVGPEGIDVPVLVFLHEGLGSLSMWKDFPDALCRECGWRGLVYSRPGYGQSTPRAADEHWGVDFMHREAGEVLPAVLEATGVTAPYALFGHSDGGSIALLHAARFPGRVSALVVLAPHVLVEEFGLESIRAARRAFQEGDLAVKLGRYHDNVASAFYGWNDIWLDPRFVAWNIERELPKIEAPVLAIQGTEDPYGTMLQIDRIAAALPTTRLLKLEHCGHSPHRDQAGAVIAATRNFLPTALTRNQP